MSLGIVSKVHIMTKINKSPDRIAKRINLSGEENEIDETDLAWQKNNLEYDLRTSEYIKEKVISSEEYARELYAALCNNEFIRRDMWQILKEESWSCSWRYAGGIIADILEKGDYMDWYCGGNEGQVSDQIKDDLYNLGWMVVNDHS